MFVSGELYSIVQMSARYQAVSSSWPITMPVGVRSVSNGGEQTLVTSSNMEDNNNSTREKKLVQKCMNGPEIEETAPYVALVGSCRLVFTMCAFFTMFNLILLRFNLSFALVCMIRVDNQTQADSNTTASGDCPMSSVSQDTAQYHTLGEFEWSKLQQGRILSAFFYGYIVSQGFGGWFSDKFGGKMPFILGNMLQSIITLLLPAASRLHPEALFGLRVVQGIVCGLSLPSLFQLYTRWASPAERTSLVAIAYTGLPIGNIIIYPLSGVLCQYGFDGGWSSIFYITGMFGLSCSIAFFFLVYDNADTHPRISEKEKLYLKQYTLKTSSKNGFLSALPYLGMLCMRIAISCTFTPIQNCTGVSLSKLRKINHTIGTVGAGVCMLLVTVLTCRDQYLAVALIALGQTVSDLAFTGGYLPTYLDMAPQYAGLLIGISNTIASLAGVISPTLVGIITPDGTREEWMLVMYITTMFYFLGATVYLIFGSSELQPWALEEYEPHAVTLQEVRNSLLDDK
ncbi:hypothetical protein L9F63_003221 [Diploptera punctata]|uniref:Major facilitator superfamily (MFS) profile domain-containing protein n=1 Tax=Diploptera punctata TaxID=6984 RepID=A0AAD7ZKX0_DIPPU|nr:hypothetical protein L9F63_003221 [Diploptera punctata]